MTCDHCHHGIRYGERVGWSPARFAWEPCESRENPIGPCVPVGPLDQTATTTERETAE